MRNIKGYISKINLNDYSILKDTNKILLNLSEKLFKKAYQIFSKLDYDSRIEVINDIFDKSGKNNKNAENYNSNNNFLDFKLNPILCKEFYKTLNVEEREKFIGNIIGNNKKDDYRVKFNFFLSEK